MQNRMQKCKLADFANDRYRSGAFYYRHRLSFLLYITGIKESF